MAQFDARHLSDQIVCNVCGGATRALFKGVHRLDSPTSMENESTMKLLGLTSVEGALRLCPACLHLFRYPLFDESLIYGERGGLCRKETYAKYFPDQTYGGQDNTFGSQWLRKSRNIFSDVSRILDHVSKLPDHGPPRSSLKILDWGGGDGYLSEVISLVSNKVLGVPCQASCFDYHEWAAASVSPYFNYVSIDQIPRNGPYDLILLSHVLEHVSFPVELLNRCAGYLAEEGRLVIIVPYEQPNALWHRSSFMHYHQNVFSVKSLSRLLAECGFHRKHVTFCNLSYRGAPRWSIVASATRGGKPSAAWTLYLVDPFILLGVLVHRCWQLLRSKLRF